MFCATGGFAFCRNYAQRSTSVFQPCRVSAFLSPMPLRILILGANGFIGSSLTRAILTQKDWEVYGMDIGAHKLEDSLGDPRFKFVEGDITINREWIEYHVKKCDAVIP